MNITTYRTTLINFHIPNHLKYHLDRLVKFKNISRTSLINRLIEDYVRSEEKQLEQDTRIHQLMMDLEVKNPTPILKNKSNHTQQRLQRLCLHKTHQTENISENFFDEPIEPLSGDDIDGWQL